MAANMNILATEVDRIVNAPYPTELKSLHGVASRTSEADIRLWAKCYACRIIPLTQSLLDALPQWSYVLDIIIRLSCAAQIRDSFVRREPSLLPSLLSQILESRSENRKYVEAAVALLSHTLPSDVPLPSAAQNFLLQLFERAAAHPDAANVRHVHRLVYGACQPILGILSPSVLSHLEEYIFSILKSSSGVEDQSLGMYCLSIMRIILERFQTGVASDDMWQTFEHSADSNNSQWTPDSIKQFFHGNKTHKTMQLLVLRVIWACRPESADPSGQGLTSVLLVNQILEGVSQTAVAEWSHKNMVIVRKLQEKCLVPDMNPALRFQVLTFLGSLSDKVLLPTQAAAFYEKALLSLGTSFVTQNQLDLSLRLSLPRLSSKFKPEWWQSLLSKILELLMDSPPVDVFQTAESYVSFLSSIADLMEDSIQCRQGLLTALSYGHCRQNVEHFFTGMATISSASVVNNSNYCVDSYSLVKNTLRSTFCSLLLRTALATPREEVFPIRHILPAIIAQHAITEPGRSTCSVCTQTRPRAVQHSSLFVEVEATPESQDSNLHWKDRLAVLMQTQAKHQQNTLINSFAKICHELEMRCENIEGPLRQERENLAALQSRHEELNKAYGEIEGQLMDRDLRISALEAENDRHDADMAATSQESRELMQRVDRANRELQEANETAQRAMAAAHQEKHELEVQHATVIACKQEALEQVREQLYQAKADTENLRSELGDVEGLRRQENAEYGRVHSEKEHLEHQLLETQTRIAQMEEERVTLHGKHGALEQDILKLQQDINNRQKQHESSLAEMEDVKQHAREEMQKMSSSFEDTMSRTKQEWLDIKTRLDEQLQNARNELAQAEEGFQQQHEANKQKTTELRKRIDRLTKECSKKDAQVTEAQEMRNRLMNAMGLTGAMAPPPEPAARSSILPVRSVSTSATPRTSLASQVPFTPAPEARHSDDDAEDEEPNSSFMSDVSADNGPTPKRARPRPSMISANTQPARTSNGPRSARTIMRTRSAIKRQPLQDMPTNRSPVRPTRSPSKVTFHHPGFGVSTAERRELEDWSFSADCILTGTPGFGLKNKEDDCLDESTADV